jgi:hypothetical protein
MLRTKARPITTEDLFADFPFFDVLRVSAAETFSLRIHDAEESASNDAVARSNRQLKTRRVSDFGHIESRREPRGVASLTRRMTRGFQHWGGDRDSRPLADLIHTAKAASFAAGLTEVSGIRSYRCNDRALRR